MATKTKSDKTASAGRKWNIVYRWKRALDLEPEEGGIRYLVYQAMKQVKTGTADDITKAAIKLGLNKATKQDPRGMTQSLLRQLAADGALTIDRPAPKTAPKKTKHKVFKKAAIVRGKGKRVVLRKRPEAAEASGAEA
jgi:hypothetical protein